MRLAQEAHVIPLIVSSAEAVVGVPMTVPVVRIARATAGCLQRELRGAYDAVVLEVEIEVVAARTRDLGAERDLGTRLGGAVAWLATGVDVQVGEVTLP